MNFKGLPYRHFLYFAIGMFLAVAATQSTSLAADCPSFFLRTAEGEIINPWSGQNDDQPYSTKQTCGYCHDYESISRGYHFQLGWDVISDNYSKKEPWRLSPGMAGGF